MANESISEKLYTYLKDKYGVEGTEYFNNDETETQPKIIDINIPGVRKNSKKHKWNAILELQDEGKTKCLILGECSPNKNTLWSRYIKVKDNNASLNYPWINLIGIMHLNKDFDFKTLKTFLDVFEDFVKNN